MTLRPSTLQKHVNHTITSTSPSSLLSFSIIEPKSYSQALKHSGWKEAMELELAALHKNHTWDLVPRPSNVNVVGNR